MIADAGEGAAGSSPRPERDAGLLGHALTLLVALAVALLLRATVVEAYRIPSESMRPTLVVGDRLFVDKLAYGARIPFTDLRLPARREPRRGEVVVFTVARDGLETRPADRHPDLPREQFVKRLVGLPGDRIAFRGDGVLVNGTPVAMRRTAREVRDGAGRRLAEYEVRDGGARYRVLDDPRVPPEVLPSFVVEPGRYYVLGDNRDHSRDSRFWGTVRREEIQGPAFLIYWSWSYDGSWLGLLDPRTWWEAEKRWERVGARL